MRPGTPSTRYTFPRWPGWSSSLAGLAILGVITLLYLFDPETSAGFLPCPFRRITGLLCPGCGAQRAIHDILHGRIDEAFRHNAALVIAIPLLGIQWAIPRITPTRWNPVHDNRIVFLWMALLLGWAVLRNLFEAPHFH
jgi:hypothetical protein